MQPGSVVTCDHMRARIGIRELRDTLTATIRRVRQGETLEVTHDGVPVAILAPVPDDRIERLVAGGEATPPVELVKPLRRYPVTGSMTASEAIEEDRAER
jgi:antitoxin (DNA-binding transcriptional repressor) of toxin-antitoxin stability system